MGADTLVADPPTITQDHLNPIVTPPDPPSQIKPNKALVHHEFTFPPFPAIPEGVTILPFSQFKESGILIEAGPDGEEVDALGIPTVPMPIRHDTDECKTKATKRKGEWDSKGRKKKKGPNGAADPALTWWEVWEDGEVTRWATSHDPNSSRYERLHAACADFTDKRKWEAQIKAETGPKYVWDKFRRYIGVSDTSSVESATKKKKRRKLFGPDSDDELSDDEVDSKHEDDAPNENGRSDATAVDAAPPEHEEPEPADTRNTGIIDPELLLLEKAQRLSEEKMYAFFEDPEKSLKIFMSSHGRRIGLYWSEDNLDIIPRLLRFFVGFILRSKVLPEIDRELNKCMKVLDLALIEMPASSTLSKHMPDRFSQACCSSWGKKTETFFFGGDSWSSAANPVIPPESHPVTSDMDVNEAKRHDSSGNTELDEAAAANVASSTPNGWGWGTAPDSAGGEIDDDDDNPWGREPEWIQDHAEEIAQAEAQLWTPVEENIISVLGPTTFLLTHKPGVVERSMRIVKTVIPPGPNIPAAVIQSVFSLESPAIELELERRFTKVVLGTSEVGWDGGESPVYSCPEILSTSQGPVIDSSDVSPPTDTPPGATLPHNPLADDITLLVEKDAPYLKDLHVGMGLGGTWVQIARDVLPKKKKGKKLKPAPSLWYISELNMVIPSFWTIPGASPST